MLEQQPVLVRDFRPGSHEQWSQHYQTLRHSGEKYPDDDAGSLHDPLDWSAVGGPENERIYGHNRGDAGNYPWNEFGGPYDSDTSANLQGRGGYLKLHEPDYGAKTRIMPAARP